MRYAKGGLGSPPPQHLTWYIESENSQETQGLGKSGAGVSETPSLQEGQSQGRYFL
jgi:hypothetical protein